MFPIWFSTPKQSTRFPVWKDSPTRDALFNQVKTTTYLEHGGSFQIPKHRPFQTNSLCNHGEVDSGFHSSTSKCSDVKQLSSTKDFSIKSILSDHRPLRSLDMNVPGRRLKDAQPQECPIDLSLRKEIAEDSRHSQTTIYGCRYCGKQYNSRSSTRLHEATHTLPFSCDICSRRFSRSWLREIHRRTHTGEKPYACDHCCRRFADRSNMRAHQRVHCGQQGKEIQKPQV